MKKLSYQKGFTLVELAIVMTIIGLLIGGILKGQELMQNARVTATIAQVKATEAAVTSFRDAYNAMPGDMLNAQNRLSNCGTYCNPLAASAGNNRVGALTTTTATTWDVPAFATGNPSAEAHEGHLFWTHLLKADLLGGIQNHQGTGTAGWGVTMPAAPIGGGFYALSGNGVAPPFSGAAANTGPSGLLLATGANPTGARVGNMQPKYAAQIDRKMDEGAPHTGSVFGLSSAAPAATGTCVTNATPPAYNEAIRLQDCTMVVRIQG
jgi:prepilin-type N-terminal cleavage/methylation domain-containing protein